MENSTDSKGLMSAPISPQVVTPVDPKSSSQEHQVLPHGEDRSPLGPNDPPAGANTSDFVVTPGGLRHRSLVHKVVPKSPKPIMTDDDRARAIAHISSGKIRALNSAAFGSPAMGPASNSAVASVTADSFKPKPPVPDASSSWVMYSFWTNNSGQPLIHLTTTWTVPPPPENSDRQTIYIFNSILNNYWILQPVLSWGPTADGGGSGWSVASWYAGQAGGGAYYTPLVPVKSGQTITGVINYISPPVPDPDTIIEWAPQNIVPNVGTSHGPSMAIYQGSLFMAWKATGNYTDIWWTSQAIGGPKFAPQQRVSNVGTDSGPALAEFGGRLHMVWKGITGDAGIWWTTFDGNQWSSSGQLQITGVGTTARPALVVWGGVLYMAWKGSNDTGIWWTTYTDESGWAANPVVQRRIPNVSTSDGPTLAVYNNVLYMAWKNSTDPEVWWTRTFDGNTWDPQRLVPGVGTSGSPSLAPLNGSLYMAWKGKPGDQAIWWSAFNGESWSTPNGAVQQPVPYIATSDGPCLVNIGGLEGPLYLGWKGADSDIRIFWTAAGGGFDYVCYFDGIDGTTLQVTDQQELVTISETLECYNITSCADYPNTPAIKMQNIAASTLSLISQPSIAWTVVNNVTVCGQNAVVVSNDFNGNGEVDLTFKNTGK